MAPPAPPTAPPPPPPPTKSDAPPAEDAAGALFAEISALGENGVRGSLKKATKGPVAAGGGDAEGADDKPKAATATPRKKAVDLGGAPKCALAGKKWTVEYQNGANGDKAVSLDADLKQTVYVFKCHDSLIKVNGKVNAIVLDGCSKTGCIFEEALASVEIVNSKDIQIQCTKTAPAVSIDGCTSVSYYMSPNYKDGQIITAKSAAINLIRPTEDDGTFSMLRAFLRFGVVALF